MGNQVVQRALDASKEREATTDKEGYLNDEISGAIQQKRGGGSPLPASLEKDVSKRFKRDFDDVRIHTDELAGQLIIYRDRQVGFTGSGWPHDKYGCR